MKVNDVVDIFLAETYSWYQNHANAAGKALIFR